MALKMLKNLFDNQIGMDICLKVEDDEREIRAHRAILMGSSKYFLKMFSSDFQEKDSKVVTLKGVDFEALEVIVEFLYTGTFFTKGRQFLSIPLNRNLIKAGDYLLMDSVIDEMSEILTFDHNLKCCPPLLDVLDKLPSETRVTIEKKILSNMEKLKPKIIQMQFKDLLQLLENPHSVPLDVKTTLITIKEWVLDGPTSRKAFAFDLLATVVFKKSDQLNTEFLIQNVLPICDSAKSKDFFIALQARFSGYKDSFTDKYFDDKKFLTSQ